MPTDHSGDQQAAPTRVRRARRLVEALLDLDSNEESDDPATWHIVDLAEAVNNICAALDPVLATVERLEAAEKARAVDDCFHVTTLGNRECVKCGAKLPDEPPASPPVPPSPPQFFDCDCGAIGGPHDIGCASFEQKLAFDRLPPVPPSPPAAERVTRWLGGSHRDIRLTELRDGEEIVSSEWLKDDKAWTTAALDYAEARFKTAESQLARLRARLGKAETWYVMAGGGDLLPGAGVSRVKPIVESLMQQYHDDRSVVPVLVLPDEPEGLTTDSHNPEPGRGTK